MERLDLNTWLCPSCTRMVLNVSPNGGSVVCKECGAAIDCSIQNRPVYVTVNIDSLPKYDHRRLAHEDPDD